MSGFQKFLLRGNVVDLAVAVLIGVAFGALVTAFTESFITPLLAAIGGKPDFSALSFTVNSSRFRYGQFLNALIAFLILAAAVYFFVVGPINRRMGRDNPTPDEPTPANVRPEFLSSMAAGTRKCAFCASV